MHLLKKTEMMRIFCKYFSFYTYFSIFIDVQQLCLLFVIIIVVGLLYFQMQQQQKSYIVISDLDSSITQHRP